MKIEQQEAKSNKSRKRPGQAGYSAGSDASWVPVVADSDDEDKEKTFNTNLTESEMAAIQEKRAQEAMRRSMDV